MVKGRRRRRRRRVRGRGSISMQTQVAGEKKTMHRGKIIFSRMKVPKINSDWQHPRINIMGFDLYQN